MIGSLDSTPEDLVLVGLGGLYICVNEIAFTTRLACQVDLYSSVFQVFRRRIQADEHMVNSLLVPVGPERGQSQ